MRTCPTCGKLNDERHNFCGQCGERIANLCGDCGFENLTTQAFCGECGKELFSESFLQKPTAQQTITLSSSEVNSAEKTFNETQEPAPRQSVNRPGGSVAVAPSPAEPAPQMQTFQSAPPDHSVPFSPSLGMPSTDVVSAIQAAPETLPIATNSIVDTFISETPKSGSFPSPVLPPSVSPVLTQQSETEPFPYSPPVFGQHRTTRQAMISYDQVLPRLTQDVQTFVSQKQQAKGQVIMLSASDGLGKSTLAQNARNTGDPIDPATEEQSLLWFGAQHYRCFSPNKILLQGWLDFLQNITGLSLEGSAQQPVHQYVQEFIQSLYQNKTPHPDMEAFLLDVFNVRPSNALDTEALGKTNQFADMMFEILKQMANIRPVALLIEDLQFADIATLDILTQVLNRRLLQQAPILIILTYSRDFYLAGPLEQALQQVPYKEYIVSDLNEAQVEQFLNNGPLGGQIQSFPVPILTALIESGHGLPLYLEEVLRLFYLNGIVTLNPETGKFVPGDAQQIQQLRIPNNLPEILELRISALSDKGRYLLQLASILGERVSIPLLLSLSQDTEEDLQSGLNELFNHGLLIPDTAGTGKFRHGLLWRSVYNSIQPELKIQLHQLVSQTLDNDFSQEMTVNPSLMAHHAEQGQLINRALAFWELTGIQMATIGQLTATTHSMFRALQLIHLLQTQVLVAEQKGTLEAQEDNLYFKLGMFNCENNPDLSVSLLSRVINYRKTLNDNSQLLEPYSFLSRCYENKGDIALALACVDESLLALSNTTYPLEYAVLLTTKVGYLFQLGRLAQARYLLEQEIDPVFSSHSLEEEPDYFKTHINARLFLADILLFQCQRKAFEIYDQCLSLAKEKHLDGLSIAIQLSKTRAYLKVGDYQRCDQEADNLLSQIEALDEPDWFLAQWGLLAMEYHLAVGDWDSARQLMLTVISRAESIHDFQTSILAQLYGAYVAFQFGQAEKAKPLFEQAIEASTQYQFAHCMLQGRIFLGELLMQQGETEKAKQVAEQALALSNQQTIQNKWFSYHATCLLARAMMQLNQVKEAGRILEKIWPDLIAIQFTPLVAETAASIGELYKNLATETPSEISKQHLLKSVQFFQKAQGLWLDLNNKHQVNKIRNAMPGL